MWIIFHLIGAGLGFILRYFSIPIALADKTVEKAGYHGSNLQSAIRYKQTTVTRRDELRSFRLDLPCSGIPNFTFTPESAADLFFKYVGLSREFQTGDSRFDSHVYISAEDPLVLRTLRENADIRKMLASALCAGVQRVSSDGDSIFVIAENVLSPDEWIPILKTLDETFARGERQASVRWTDPFVHRVLIIEATIWGMAGYAVTAFIEFAYVRAHDVHVHTSLVLAAGIGLGLAFAALGLALIVAILRRSSRSHRPIVESALVLGWALPLLGVQLASDLNLGLQGSQPPVLATVLVTEKNVQYRRRGADVYQLTIAEVQSRILLPTSINVPKDVFDSASVNQRMKLEIGIGGLGMPYYRSMNGLPIP